MTSSGLSEPKIAVPATMTLLPRTNRFHISLDRLGQEQIGHTCFGTDINCLGTYTSIHFNIFIGKPCTELCDLGNAAVDKLLAAAAWKCSLSVLEREIRILKRPAPGYTVMTRSRSASSPTSSDIEVEGVSGEMATPAFMRLSWTAWMRETGSAGSR
jgi:hypothetical protein